MTRVYFVRHAQPNFDNHSDALRELTPKGMQDRSLVTNFLKNRQIDVAVSSPYKRAIDTIREFTDLAGLEIELVGGFRERRVDSCWIEDFSAFARRQWADFSFKLSDGECLGEVQQRNVAALKALLERHSGKNIVVGSHGTALSTVLNYYDRSYGYQDFADMKDKMPWIVELVFDEEGKCLEIKKHDLY